MSDLNILKELVGELAMQPTKQGQAGALRRLLSQEKPTVYLHEDTNCVVLSALSEQHPDAEKYWMDLVGIRISGRADSASNTLTILRNILERAGVSVVIE